MLTRLKCHIMGVSNLSLRLAQKSPSNVLVIAHRSIGFAEYSTVICIIHKGVIGRAEARNHSVSTGS